MTPLHGGAASGLKSVTHPHCFCFENLIHSVDRAALSEDLPNTRWLDLPRCCADHVYGV